jgi:hypothetical protein
MPFFFFQIGNMTTEKNACCSISALSSIEEDASKHTPSSSTTNLS